jgi:hypothetical protein
MSTGNGAPRLWSAVPMIVGVIDLIFVTIGTNLAMIGAFTFGQATAILLIGTPLAALFASGPIALGQGPRALADVAEYVRDRQSSVR